LFFVGLFFGHLGLIVKPGVVAPDCLEGVLDAEDVLFGDAGVFGRSSAELF
jgi:hypothetical protein